jgi:molybdenum cofactor cytidylyltransferase
MSPSIFSMNWAAIILAAGSSSRMGQSKQLLPVNGQPLLMRTVKAVLAADLSSTIVVLGSNEERHRKLLQHLPVEAVFNPDWENGIGSSLKAGLEHALHKDAALDGVVILVCDQPLLSGKNISNLLATYTKTGKPVIASRYAGVPGVPAFFSKSYFDQLKRVADQEGAKKIILQNPADVAEVEFLGGEVDLDTMKEYQDFRAKNPGN